MATVDDARPLAFSGTQNPHPGKLGIVQVYALANLLLANGDPVANIKLIEYSAQNSLINMNDGAFYKDSFVAPNFARNGYPQDRVGLGVSSCIPRPTIEI